MYTTHLYIHEKLDFAEGYSEHAYTCKWDSKTLDEAHNIEDRIWVAIEVYALDNRELYIEFFIEKDDEYVDSDEAIIKSNIVRTSEPSSFITWNQKAPDIMSIDREKSSVDIQEEV